MPKPRKTTLESPTARAKLAVRKKPYTVKIAPGIHLGYRRNEGPGTWSVRCADGHGSEWLKRIALADDLEPAAPPAVLDYWGALDMARKLGRRQPGAPEDDSRPLTVSEALDRYETHLNHNGGDAYNAHRARLHLTGALLSKPVALIGRGDLLRWRDGLLAKGLAPATVNRTANVVRAALELAAAQDRRITNVLEFKMGLPTLPGARVARNVVLDDATVHRLVAACYAQDRKLGVLADLMSVTGCRPSQASRLAVKHLVGDPVAPVLKMPKSGKGGTTDRAARKAKTYTVHITPELAAVLKQEATGRKPDDPLLTRANGESWGKNPHAEYRADVIAAVKAIGRDPDEVTLYALRHSSIVRALTNDVPIRIVAATHDTSVQQIERTYSDHITEHSDEVSRKGLLRPEPGDNVVTLAGRRPS